MSGKRKAENQLTDRDEENGDAVAGSAGGFQRASNDVMQRRRVVRAPRRNKESGEIEAPEVEESEQYTEEKIEEKTSTESIENSPKESIQNQAQLKLPAWPTFSFASTSTPPAWPSFTFAGPGLSFNTSPAVFPAPSEKKEEPSLSKIKSPSSSPKDTKIEWPSFSNPLQSATFSFNTSPSKSTENPFKLDAALGTLSGIGADADKTRELTNSPSVWGRDISLPKEPVTGIGSGSSPQSKNLKLSKIDNHTTGEEGESTECEVRGRLFEFVKEEGKLNWKERGVGPFKVNSDNKNNRYRIVMRTDNALRVVLNALIYSEMTVEKPNDRQLRFTCVNTLDSPQKIGSFLLKLANSADTDAALKSLQTCKPKSKSLAAQTSTSSDGKSTSDATESDAVSTSDATESKGAATESEEATESDATTESTATVTKSTDE